MDEENVDKESEEYSSANIALANTRWSIVYLITIIGFVILFQMFALTSLEFNLYVITEYESSSDLQENISFLKKLKTIQEKKSKVAPVKIKLSAAYDNFEVEVPGAFMYDN